VSHRLFVGIRPPPPIRDMLIDRMEALDGARWQDDDQLHVTLRFVGEVDARQADDLVAALASVHGDPFPLSLAGIGHFERKGRAHTLWAGLGESEALRQLQSRVEMACRRVGLAPETRKFAPHITIARLNGGTAPVGPWISEHGDLASQPWIVDGFTLFESHLSAAGALYEPVRRYALTR